MNNREASVLARQTPGPPLDMPAVCRFVNTYVATNGSTGPIHVQMLGNPTSTPVVDPTPFVMYASGANRGYLLDVSTTLPR